MKTNIGFRRYLVNALVKSQIYDENSRVCWVKNLIFAMQKLICRHAILSFKLGNLVCCANLEFTTNLLFAYQICTTNSIASNIEFVVLI